MWRNRSASEGEYAPDRSVVASTLMMLTCPVLGTLTGGMLLIGVSFLGFWKRLSPGDFQAWFAAHSHLIGRLMVPLGAGGVAVTLAAAVACWRGSAASRRWLLIAAASVVGVMVTYPLSFAGANAAFVRGGLSDSDSRSLLDRWATWHWIRSGLVTFGFFAALRALAQHRSRPASMYERGSPSLSSPLR
jgi:hypothetical protein